jgi:hypothetical protein
MDAGKECVQAVMDLNYENSLSAKYDPLSSHLSTAAICAQFNDNIAHLKSTGTYSLT